MARRLLLLGSTGKMGSAVREVFGDGYDVIGVSSRDFDAADSDRLTAFIEETNPDIVVNTVAHLGIDSCEMNPGAAHRLNALLPKHLAGLSRGKGYLLVHFSTDAVFDDNKGDFYLESDQPNPLNVYGLTKYEGDRFVQATAERYFLVRTSILFGQATRRSQFVERMLVRAVEGNAPLRVADDIVLSPSHAEDVAREVRRMLEGSCPFGLYHVANEGKATLYELMAEVVAGLGLDVPLERASHRDFPAVGTKNTHTPLASEKIPPLRPWREAVRAYCEKMTPGVHQDV
ncbi:NAD(P)-dependent oxidoreductase [Geobacter sp.]|uniref:SDR family oxidoreductase n=1 Tax=Geobacter sp. TaxID=46610 RepID=UPI0027B9ABA3|nr:NAD(P)-dependent oxidoreductase [Geobacter sp.]